MTKEPRITIAIRREFHAEIQSIAQALANPVTGRPSLSKVVQAALKIGLAQLANQTTQTTSR